MIFGYAISGGGGNGKSGATLTVTAPIGSTVTVSKGSESYSSTMLPAVFSGLSTGTWTISYTDGSQSGQASVDITADYSATVAYFSATINITYPSGSTCTVSKDGITLTAPDTSGTWACTVPESGTWTVTATDGTNEKSQTVEITAQGESVNVELAYWNGELYDMGDEFASVTGGWTVTGYTGFDAGGGGTLNADHIYLPIRSPRVTYYAGTQNPVDVTGWNQINISYATSEGGELSTIYLDIASVTGSYYVAVTNYIPWGDITINVGILQSKTSNYFAKKSVVLGGVKYIYKIWMS